MDLVGRGTVKPRKAAGWGVGNSAAGLEAHGREFAAGGGRQQPPCGLDLRIGLRMRGQVAAHGLSFGRLQQVVGIVQQKFVELLGGQHRQLLPGRKPGWSGESGTKIGENA